MNELRVGMVGMGKMGLLHAGILNSLSNVRVKAVADTEKLVTRFLKENMPKIEVFNDYEKMIRNSELDIVYVTTPVISHIPIASFCTKEKLHFFVEKPLGRNAEECISLCKLVKENKVSSMVGFCLRYAETFAKAKELLDKQVLGKIINIKSSVYQSQSITKGTGWRFKKETSGGGVLIDLGSHLVDLLLWYFGEIKTVQGTTQSQHSQEIEDSASVMINFANNLPCSLETSWNAKNYRLQETTIEIEGVYGKMKVNEDHLAIVYNPSEKDNDKQNVTFYRQSLYNGVAVDIGGPEYTREDLDFIYCIRNGKTSSLNVIDSTKTQSVIDSIYRSSKNGNVEKVSYIV